MASNENGWKSYVADFEKHDFHFSFTIKNFLEYFCKPGEKLETANMECSKNCGAKWALQIYAHGPNEKEKDNIGVYLNLVEQPSYAQIVSAYWEVYVIGKRGEALRKVGPVKLVEEQLKLAYGFSCLITRTEIQKDTDIYLAKGQLTVRCVGKAFLNKPNPTPSIGSVQPSNVLKKIYEESIYCDVVVKSGLSQFHCHKAILAATSDYFKTVFQNETKKKTVVDLSKDLDGDELRAMLDYIYCGKREISLSDSSLQTLFKLADTYEVDGWKDVCEAALISQLNAGNVTDLFNFADQYKAKLLKKKAALMIANSTD